MDQQTEVTPHTTPLLSATTNDRMTHGVLLSYTEKIENLQIKEIESEQLETLNKIFSSSNIVLSRQKSQFVPLSIFTEAFEHSKNRYPDSMKRDMKLGIFFSILGLFWIIVAIVVFIGFDWFVWGFIIVNFLGVWLLFAALITSWDALKFFCCGGMDKSVQTKLWKQMTRQYNCVISFLEFDKDKETISYNKYEWSYGNDPINSHQPRFSEPIKKFICDVQNLQRIQFANSGYKGYNELCLYYKVDENKVNSYKVYAAKQNSNVCQLCVEQVQSIKPCWNNTN
eukprot:119732_1